VDAVGRHFIGMGEIVKWSAGLVPCRSDILGAPGKQVPSQSHRGNECVAPYIKPKSVIIQIKCCGAAACTYRNLDGKTTLPPVYTVSFHGKNRAFSMQRRGFI